MQPNNSNKTQPSNARLWLIFAGVMLIAACAVCFVGVGLTGAILYYRYDQLAVLPTLTPETAVIIAKASPQPSPTLQPPPTATPPASPTTPLDASITPPAASPTMPPPVSLPIFPPDNIVQDTIPSRAYADINQLLTADYPVNDYFETTERLSASKLGERTVTAPPYQRGDSQTFSTDDGDVQATLMGLTPHAYFWVEQGLDYDPAVVQALAERLENDYYPRLVNLFGQEWQPGVDNDPHFSVLHLAGNTSASELGYFSSVDQYPKTLYAESNEQEMVYLNMGNLELGEDLYFGTLVHELQHLIQWYVDPNETTWLNEGLSQLAEIYVGLDTATAVDYSRRPETRLNTWDYETDAIDAHYSAAYLYAVYVWEQLGETAVQELARHPANGLASVDAVLQGYAPERSLAAFTADWAAANFLDDANAGSAYHYEHLDLGRPAYEWRIKELPQENTYELGQFATHYVELDVRGPLTITFAGDTTAPLLNTTPRSGEQMWYAQPQDDTNARLTAVFDLTALTQATLNFAAWYDLEEEYDFAYLSISTDNGKTWTLLVPDHATPGEFGPGYNGRSEYENDHLQGWVKESIPLTPYVGQPVQIRFDVLTDSAVTGRGFAIDDITIPELGYSHDVETPLPEWTTQGFVPIGSLLPQQWAVQLIEPLGATPRVTQLPLTQLNQGQWQTTIGNSGGVLAITPLTPFVDSPANYWLKIEQ